MKKEEIIINLPETDKLPIGYLVWTCTENNTNTFNEVEIISVLYNTNSYLLINNYKPTNKIINLSINENN